MHYIDAAMCLCECACMVCAPLRVCFCFVAGLGVNFLDVVWLGGKERCVSGNSTSPRLPHCQAVNHLVSLPAQQQRLLPPAQPITSSAPAHCYEDSRRLDVCL